jgi:hypothetical protein
VRVYEGIKRGQACQYEGGGCPTIARTIKHRNPPAINRLGGAPHISFDSVDTIGAIRHLSRYRARNGAGR